MGGRGRSQGASHELLALYCFSEIFICMGLSFARLLKLNQFDAYAILQLIGTMHE